MHLNIYTTFHLTAEEYTFFLSVHRLFTEIRYMLDHKTCLNKFKKIEIISNTFSDQSGMKLEIKNRRKAGKPTNIMELDNIFLNY